MKPPSRGTGVPASFLTGDDVALVDDTQHTISELEAEVAMLRGISASAPPLDFEQPDVEELAERMQEELVAVQHANERRERTQVQEALQARDGAARGERQELLQYLDVLRGRDDETGDAMRGPEFGRLVDSLASEGAHATRSAMRPWSRACGPAVKRPAWARLSLPGALAACASPYLPDH